MSESLAGSGTTGKAATSSLLNSLAAKFLSRTLVFQFPLHLQPSLQNASQGPDQLLLASPDSILQLFAHPDDAHRRRRFLHFLHTGCTGFLFARDGKWSAYGWCSSPGKGHPPHLPRTANRLGAWWLFYSHTREDLRGQGLYKRLLARVVQFIHEQQEKPLILVDTKIDNIASQRAILRSGFVPSGQFVTQQLWIPALGALPLHGRWEPIAPHPSAK